MTRKWRFYQRRLTKDFTRSLVKSSHQLYWFQNLPNHFPISGIPNSAKSIAPKQETPAMMSVPAKHPRRPINFISIKYGHTRKATISTAPFKALLTNISPASAPFEFNSTIRNGPFLLGPRKLRLLSLFYTVLQSSTVNSCLH